MLALALCQVIIPKYPRYRLALQQVSTVGAPMLGGGRWVQITDLTSPRDLTEDTLLQFCACQQDVKDEIQALLDEVEETGMTEMV